MLKMVKKLGEKGQTSVEYILMIAVVVTLITTMMGRVKEYILAEKDNCPPEPKSLVCKYDKILKESFEHFILLQ